MTNFLKITGTLVLIWIMSFVLASMSGGKISPLDLYVLFVVTSIWTHLKNDKNTR